MARSLTVVGIVALALASATTSRAGSKAEQYYGATKDGTRKMQHLPPPVRERIWNLPLEAPSLDYEALATKYAADPLLKGLRAWSAHEVGYLRFTSKLVPSDRQRLEVLAAIAAKRLDGASLERGLRAAVDEVAKSHPGVTTELLTTLAGKHPALAVSLRRFETSARAPAHLDVEGEARRLISTDRALVDELALGDAQIARTLERPGSPLRASIRETIVELERSAGDNDGRLRPLDASALRDPVTSAVLENVWARLGRRELAIEDIDAALPHAIAELAVHTAALRAIRARAVAEVLGDLATRYADEVVGGHISASELANRRKLTYAQWKTIQDAAPSLFPDLESLPLGGARLDGVARLYGELAAGRIGSVAFYTRAKIPREQLLVLQNSDPRFARTGDTKSWQTVAGSKRIALDDALLVSLPAHWQADVIEGGMGLLEFGRKHGVDRQALDNLVLRYPERFPRRSVTIDNEALTQRLAEGIAKARQRDPFQRTDDIIARLAADPEIRALLPTGVELTRSRYEILRKKSPERFTDLNDPSGPMAQIAADVRGILEEEPTLHARGIAERLRARYPRARLSRIYQLRRLHPEVFTREVAVATPTDTRRADAEKLVALKLASPRRPYKAIVEHLRKRQPRWTLGYLAGLRLTFDQEVFSPAGLGREDRGIDRPVRMLSELASLAGEILPPGFTEAQLVEATNRLLEERRQKPLPGPLLPDVLRRNLAAADGTMDQIGARRVVQLVAEYATAAHRGASEADVLAAIRKDYPHLTAVRLGPYRSLWREEPARYPALTRFFDGGGALGFRGLGKTVRKPRFLGGWDAKRALIDHADEATHEAIARRTDFARITTRLPLLDQMIEDLDGKKPLAHQHVMMVSHLLGSTVALTQALAAAGATQDKMIVVGSPLWCERGRRGDPARSRHGRARARAVRARVSRGGAARGR